jgi:glycosyltransferase 2 family protein
MKRAGLQAALAVLKLGVSTALLAYLFSRADTGAMWAQFRHMNPLWTVAALATYGLMLAVSAWRWRLLLQMQTVDVGLGTLTRSFLVATFFNNFLPSNIGGDVVRVADTAPFTQSKTLATTVVLLDRILGLIALLAIAAIASGLAYAVGLPLEGTQYLWVALAALGAGLLLGLRHAEALTRPLHRMAAGRFASVETRIRRLGHAVERFRDQPRGLWFAFAGALAVQCLLVLFYVFAARSLAVPFPLLAASVIVPVSLAVQMMPVSINGFGVREAVFTFFFTSLGLNVSSALTLSLGSAVLIMLFSLSGGAVFVMRGWKPLVVSR